MRVGTVSLLGVSAREFGAWLLVVLLLVLSAILLPLPESPFLLGASLAVVLWLTRSYMSFRSE